MKKNILFDLDGTITDSAEGIMNSCRYALKKMNAPMVQEKDLLCVIGPPLQFSFMNYFHMDKKEADQAISYYREYYVEKGLYENRVYKDVRKTLELLTNHSLFIATSKPEKFAKMILRHFEMDHFFQDICGASMDGTIKEKDQVIEKVIRKNHLNPKETIMVGDRIHDFEGAKIHHLYSIGVAYGYGSQKELEQADAVIQSFDELIGKLR